MWGQAMIHVLGVFILPQNKIFSKKNTKKQWVIWIYTDYKCIDNKASNWQGGLILKFVFERQGIVVL